MCMTTAATSFRPAWALCVWVDNNNLFTELPAISGPPLIQKYPLTSTGLSSAIAMMREIHRAMQPAGGTYKALAEPRITRPKPIGTSAQREKAAGILKKMGLT